MKSFLPLLSACLISLPAIGHAQSEKIDTDKAKDALQKLLGEAKDAVEKASKKSGDEKEESFWERSKENLGMERKQYIKKATTALAVMQVEIQGLENTESSVATRVYFKMRVEALKQQHAYCIDDLTKMQAMATEEEFRSRQRFFDRNLTSLSDHLVVTMKEAGH